MILPTLLASIATASAYVWPSPKLDALEAFRWEQSSTGLGLFVRPCKAFGKDALAGRGRSGRANVPDWIRTAYHDMATHNVADGTCGLDASIRFPEEQSRPENAGTGFDNSMHIFRTTASRHISQADLVAIGLITAVESCGSPEIAFRGGRMDAAEPNAPGVPETQQDLDAHIASFARQGFTKTEMIGLVACGHSFGGVEHATFPEIVSDLRDPDNLLSVAHFDSTFTDFDNKVVTEYLDNTTRNPLIIATNDTFNSDKRIFASDGNATMRSFGNSPDLFASTCADLFARMLDTVPRGVQLTEVIKPLPIKPADFGFVVDGDKLLFSGKVRLWDVSLDDSRVVRLLWDDHTGVPSHNITLVFETQTSSTGGRIIAEWYRFMDTPDVNGPLSIALDPAAGITSMRFTVNDKLENQGGLQFAVDDRLALSASSCLTSEDPVVGRIDVAVRNGVNPKRVFLEQEARDDVDRLIVQETEVSRPARLAAVNFAYSLWSIDITDPTRFTIGAEIDGVKISTTVTHGLFDFALCTK
ncbi:putative L-ascorbate oxidase [Mycena rebaudengoi]|nr:putative L-ascorbate oxidase [Mycena rebaudengoi]